MCSSNVPVLSCLGLGVSFLYLFLQSPPLVRGAGSCPIVKTINHFQPCTKNISMDNRKKNKMGSLQFASN